MNEKLRDIYKRFFKYHFPYYKRHIDHDFDKVKIKEGGFITFFLKLFGYRGICLFRKIHYVKGSVKKEEMPKFIVHELTHTIQYRREGILAFPFKYIFNIIKDGYKKSKYEEEANYYTKMFSIWCKKEKIKLDKL
jgi:hypothetical protein